MTKVHGLSCIFNRNPGAFRGIGGGFKVVLGMTEVKSRILKTENVRWKDLKVIQPSGFKDLSKDAYVKLRQSILANNFIDPFKVWQNCEDLYVVDGVHRVKVLNELEKEGHIVSQEFPANFIKLAGNSCE